MERLGQKFCGERIITFMLTDKEKLRYDRQIILPEMGEDGQNKLKSANVLVVGAGGLGCPALQYLSAAGVGTIGVIDDDTVAVSNLHRQIMYNEADIGKQKVLCIKEKLLLANPHIEIRSYAERLTVENALNLIRQYDIILDGSDNFATRYLVNDACVILKKPFVYGAIFQFEGQVSVFNYNSGPTYRCLFPEPPVQGTIPSCSEAGVVGVLPGIIGSFQASEVIKMITGFGDPLSGQLYMIDLRTNTTNTIKFKANSENLSISNLIADYNDTTCSTQELISEIDATELRAWLQKEERTIQLIDVREKQEYEVNNIGGENFPLSSLGEYLSKIKPTKKTVVCCKSGGRSRLAIEQIKEAYPEIEIYNLRHGIGALNQ